MPSRVSHARHPRPHDVSYQEMRKDLEMTVNMLEGAAERMQELEDITKAQETALQVLTSSFKSLQDKYAALERKYAEKIKQV